MCTETIMKTDLSAEDVVVHLATPQMIGGEGEGEGGVVSGVSGVSEAARSSAAVEFGRRLLVAARAGDTNSVKLLMAKGAPFTTDWLGTSPLHLAAGEGHAETVGVLLRAGVSRDARSKVERTALHCAAAGGHARCVAALAAGGAAVEARDLLRMTPLHWAAQRGHVAAAAALLDHGADPHALSKFRKTPLQLAAAHPALQRLMREHLERRALTATTGVGVGRTGDEAARAATTTSEPGTVRIQKISESKVTNPKIVSTPEKKHSKPTLKIETGGGGGGGGGGRGEAGAEALLRRHGITLLPQDDTNTVLSALQSGRTVVLSDAGKLMLKESGAGGGGGASAGGGGGGGGGAGEGGVVLTATPVAAPPPGVKVFTLSSAAKLLPPPAAAPPPATHNTHDVQQVKLVQLGAGAGAAGGSRAVAGAGTARGGRGGGGRGRGAVRIIMNKQNFRKLIATATRATISEDATEGGLELDSSSSSDGEAGEGAGAGEGGGEGAGEGESVVVVPEQFVRSMSPQYLRSQLLCAHAALHHLHARLQRARARARLKRAPHPHPAHPTHPTHH